MLTRRALDASPLEVGILSEGLMSRFHWTQASDLWEPQAALKIANGLTLAAVGGMIDPGETPEEI